MAGDEPSGARPGPAALRIKLRYDTVETMVQRFAINVGKSGLFLPTQSMQPVGTEVKFELRLASDAAVLIGLGRVKLARPPDPAQPKACFGLAIELMRVTRESRELIMRMLDHRRATGLPEVTIPMPDDLDAARRANADTSPSVDSAGIARSSPPTIGEHLLTSARPTSGPLAVAKTETARPMVMALAPEPPKATRPRLSELIARAAEASGALAVAEVPGLEDNVDVERALVRARALAGGDLDVELAALRESSAAPIEITIESASAELARKLGGNAVRRSDRSARWAPPPSVTSVTTVAAESVAVALAAAPARLPALVVDDPADGDGDVEQLADDDLESADEPTEIGGAPGRPTELQAHAPMPSAPIDLADRLDAQLVDAEPEGEPDAEEVSDLDVLAETDITAADVDSAAVAVAAINDLPEDPPASVFGAAPAPAAFDFAARLDLGDDDDEQFDEPHGFATRTPVPAVREPAAQESRMPRMPRSAPPENYDLENVLETLDVDLDQLSIARDPARPAARLPGLPVEREPSRSRSGRAKRVATEDDGVMIDFDDDE